MNSDVFLDKKIIEWKQRLDCQRMKEREEKLISEKMVKQEKDLTALVFHEIRNPLYVIVFSTEYLLDNFARVLGPEVKSELHSIACSS
mmetsp:Transcript_24605/g.51317  ORF Transcript_24605/g.51317 Transcript_24605/m.51317 type:complete len:88 (-) Transcript_24605:441-704(-)